MNIDFEAMAVLEEESQNTSHVAIPKYTPSCYTHNAPTIVPAIDINEKKFRYARRLHFASVCVLTSSKQHGASPLRVLRVRRGVRVVVGGGGPARGRQARPPPRQEGAARQAGHEGQAGAQQAVGAGVPRAQEAAVPVPRGAGGGPRALRHVAEEGARHVLQVEPGVGPGPHARGSGGVPPGWGGEARGEALLIAAHHHQHQQRTGTRDHQNRREKECEIDTMVYELSMTIELGPVSLITSQIGCP